MGWGRGRRWRREQTEDRREAMNGLYATAAIVYKDASRIMAEGLPRPIDFDEHVQALGDALRHFGVALTGREA